MKNKMFLYLSLPQAALIIIVACFGLYYPATYQRETATWYAQCIGQDILNLLLLAPLLIVTAIFSYHNKKVFLFLFGGAELYIAYNFAIYCFAIHYNFLFLPYCFVLGLSVYSFIYTFAALDQRWVNSWFDDRTPVRLVGAFLLALAVIFYGLWLSMNLPAAIHNTIPEEITKNGLFTNPVHVLDISIFLPGVVLTGISLIQRRRLGYLMAPVILVFCLLITVTIGTLALVMKYRSLSSDLSVVWIMCALALSGIAMLYLLLSHLGRHDKYTKFIIE